jgi:hypothetical protein
MGNYRSAHHRIYQLTKVVLKQAEVIECLNGLWRDAFSVNSLDSIFALLRVTGMQSQNWEAITETEAAFQDYNWHLRAKSKKLSEKSSWRIGLLMYCHACEMSSVHNTLKNLLAIGNGEPFRTDPFKVRLKKDKLFKGTPPSATLKWRELAELAEKCGNTNLYRLVEAVYNDSVRNAFSHSDYIITADEFRWTEAFSGSISLVEVGNLISNSFVFFPTMLSVQKSWLNELSKKPRYFPMSNYEVLELLKLDGMVNGLKIHFSTGEFAKFQRTDAGVTLINFLSQSDGSLQLIMGNLADQKNCYVVDGVQHRHLETRWTDHLGD